MKRKIQFAGCVLVLMFCWGLPQPSAAQRPHANAAPAQRPPKPANPAARQQRQEQRQQARQQFRQGAQNGTNRGTNANGARPPGQSTPDWNRPARGTPRADRPPSANVPPKSYNNLTPQEKQRVLDNNRKWQNLSPGQRQDLADRGRVWQQMTPAQRDHIKNDVLPRWKQLPQDRRRAIQQRLGVLKNMPESARNQHLNDPNFTRGMSEEDKSSLRDLSHLHVGGAPDPPND